MVGAMIADVAFAILVPAAASTAPSATAAAIAAVATALSITIVTVALLLRLTGGLVSECVVTKRLVADRRLFILARRRFGPVVAGSIGPLAVTLHRRTIVASPIVASPIVANPAIAIAAAPPAAPA